MALLARRVGVLAAAGPSVPRTFVRGKSHAPQVVRRPGQTVSQEEIEYRRNQMPHMDPGSAAMPTIPIWVPGSLSQFSQPHMKTGLGRVSQWLAMRFQDRMASWQSVWTMFKYKGFPREVTTRTTPRAFATLLIGSTREKAWIGPIRRAALEAYKELNTAIASRDTATVKLRARGDFGEVALDRMPPKGRKFVWTLHKEVHPVKCLAWRAHAFQRQQDCAPGTNGFLVQALFRFDTMQSLTEVGSGGTPRQERVTEYLVLEKRNWQANWPWAIVAQGTPGQWVGDEVMLGELYATWAPQAKK
ncbi:hypothetical protein AURDEDRAFT_182019 [Auricularia subglabra TFB-10046 SS5]|nr:hypothetical protein AURDEDRAFT_182019 [Auricularia subglabra TFB-10046 SS5]